MEQTSTRIDSGLLTLDVSEPEDLSQPVTLLGEHQTGSPRPSSASPSRVDDTMAERDADADADEVENQCSALQEDELTVLEVSRLDLQTSKEVHAMYPS